MELEYTISAKDYIEFNVFHYEHSKTIKKQKLIIGLLIPATLFVLGLAISDGFTYPTLFMPVFFAIIWFAFGSKLYKRSVRRTVERMIKEGQGKEFIGSKILSLNEDKISLSDKDQSIEALYTRVEKITSDSERLYIYVGSLSAIIIPFSAFKDEKEKETLLNIIKERSNSSI